MVHVSNAALREIIEKHFTFGMWHDVPGGYNRTVALMVNGIQRYLDASLRHCDEDCLHSKACEADYRERTVSACEACSAASDDEFDTTEVLWPWHIAHHEGPPPHGD